MTNEKKIDFIINLIPLVVAGLKQVPGAIELLSKASETLKNGVTDEELESASVELEVALTNLIAATEPPPNNVD